MSIADRKIGYYTVIFEKYGNNEKFFDKQFFLNFINFVDNFGFLMKINKSNKAISIERTIVEQINYLDLAKMIIKSCKYNHSPDYMSSVDGTTRDSDKKLHEGDKELTHLCLKLDSHEAELILEERRSGVTINELGKYLNHCLKEYLRNIGLPINFRISFGIIPSEDFLSSLNGMTKVKVGEIYKHKRILGSEAMGLLQREDLSMQENVILTMKAKKGESLGKTMFKRFYESLTGDGSEITRIRIFGQDENRNSIRLDSEVMKKLEYVRAELEDNGTVNSRDVLDKMAELLGVSFNEVG
ncbi:hypothetical protein AA0X95_11090 [Bacillus sp. 1P10SD]|uniref:hypothetical protein n=1 Tax=Bacillus sp. 1P10SD TaxID=3132265 RepID=UPI0039A50EEA